LLALACGTGTITAPGGGAGPPPGSANHAPQVTVSPAPTVTPIAEGGTTLLSVTADDPDGDSLGYAWTQTSPATPAGTFSSRTVRNPTWTAPAVSADTVFTFAVTVTDGQGGSTTQSCQVTVTHTTVNRPPSVSSSITVSPAMPVAGQVVTLSVSASDPDGDPLTIAWTQTSPAQQGTFGSPSTASTTWISPALGVDSLGFSLQVSVADGHNPTEVRQVTVTVSTPSYDGGVQPIWTTQCVSCHDAPTSTNGQLTLIAGASRAALVSQPMVHACSDATRVVPGDPAGSGLMDKLTGTSCGTRMPEGSNPLSAGALVMIQSWILRGALDN
ncbi:MAG TPA: putative Ig domain-containing protein, partial [Myxococcaceae bacterium]|nr:putative Ig domain-containing protein [Myxococcaceae bacterium]